MLVGIGTRKVSMGLWNLPSLSIKYGKDGKCYHWEFSSDQSCYSWALLKLKTIGGIGLMIYKLMHLNILSSVKFSVEEDGEIEVIKVIK